MHAVLIKIATEWYQVKTDGSKCDVCEQVICSDMYQLYFFINYDPIETTKKVCDGCYSLINDTTGKK